MASEKKLYRSRNSLIGGVCSGIAEYFNIDPIIVQILTVVLTLATAGLLAIAYLALWIIIPPAPSSDEPVEVKPQEVHSDTYGPVKYYQVNYEGEANMPQNQSSQTPSSYDPYSGAAHVPPQPPVGQTQPVNQAYTVNQPYVSVPGTEIPEPTAQHPPVGSSSAAVPPATGTPPAAPTRGSATGALWFGLILLFIGVTALLGVFVTGVSWWQFWPLILVIGGLAQMIVPGRKGHRMEHFVNGLILFAFGAAALTMSLGFVSISSLGNIFWNLWPVLLIMCGFFVLGGAMKAPLFTLLAGLCFVAFCVIGIGWFSLPGPTDMITFTLPTGQVYNFVVDFWN